MNEADLRRRMLALLGVSPEVTARVPAVTAQAASGEVLLYGPIVPHEIAQWFDEGVSARQFRDALAAVRAADEVVVRINSPGGDVWEASAMAQAVTERRESGGRVRMIVDGVAASSASLVMVAGDRITVAALASVMIHVPTVCVCGGAEDLRRMADFVARCGQQMAEHYARRMRRSTDDVMAMLEAETWMTAQEARRRRPRRRSRGGRSGAARTAGAVPEPQPVAGRRHRRLGEPPHAVRLAETRF